MNQHPSQTLATFAAELSFAQIPEPVIRRAEDLMLDWLGSALAGKVARPVAASTASREHDGAAPTGRAKC